MVQVFVQSCICKIICSIPINLVNKRISSVHLAHCVSPYIRRSYINTGDEVNVSLIVFLLGVEHRIENISYGLVVLLRSL